MIEFVCRVVVFILFIIIFNYFCSKGMDDMY